MTQEVGVDAATGQVLENAPGLIEFGPVACATGARATISP